MVFTKIKGTVLGPYTKDHRTLGSIFGSPDLRAVIHACHACIRARNHFATW